MIVLFDVLSSLFVLLALAMLLLLLLQLRRRFDLCGFFVAALGLLIITALVNLGSSYEWVKLLWQGIEHLPHSAEMFNDKLQLLQPLAWAILFYLIVRHFK